MLKGIPSILSPELMKILMEMGHGDELVLADGNFPASSCAKRLIRADGHDIPELLHAILTFLPLDQYVKKPAALMEVVPGDPEKPDIWGTYSSIMEVHHEGFRGFEMVERFAFYDRARNAYAVIASSEKSLYANIILKKGVVR
ncbi:RbsD/FucU family protein [Peribacillus kribbensis]|uniref:RbsD/FucU family protein n=1 Tax=Peribacillus kribbensis TaxID=356658 RepID=UPI0003FED131|nr:RbsD/FucU domain-containing protein [Peribacillus kribbensis]